MEIWVPHWKWATAWYELSRSNVRRAHMSYPQFRYIRLALPLQIRHPNVSLSIIANATSDIIDIAHNRQRIENPRRLSMLSCLVTASRVVHFRFLHSWADNRKVSSRMLFRNANENYDNENFTSKREIVSEWEKGEGTKHVEWMLPSHISSTRQIEIFDLKQIRHTYRAQHTHTHTRNYAMCTGMRRRRSLVYSACILLTTGHWLFVDLKSNGKLKMQHTHAIIIMNRNSSWTAASPFTRTHVYVERPNSSPNVFNVQIQSTCCHFNSIRMISLVQLAVEL